MPNEHFHFLCFHPALTRLFAIHSEDPVQRFDCPLKDLELAGGLLWPHSHQQQRIPLCGRLPKDPDQGQGQAPVAYLITDTYPRLVTSSLSLTLIPSFHARFDHTLHQLENGFRFSFLYYDYGVRSL